MLVKMIRNLETRNHGLQRHFPNHQQEPAELNAKSDGYPADAEASINLFPEERQTKKTRCLKQKTEDNSESGKETTPERKSGKEKKPREKSERAEEKIETEPWDDFHPAECTAALRYFLSDSASVWNKLSNIVDEMLVEYRK
ncbi:MAG TPA: hypothetical protein O0X42_02080 [Methanocorpusculum sp.]|nr:hypothetical protein [Methanocorpusculum sp.]